MHYSKTDVLVIGSGLAGLYAAINCRMQGMQVVVCSKSQPGRGSCSAISQGHFRASTASFTSKEHKQLTLEAGKGLNQQERLDVLVEHAAQDVQRLQEFGVGLKTRAKGYESSPDRIGQEGLSITKPMTSYAQSIGVGFSYPFFAWRLAVADGRAIGVWGFEPGNTEPVLLASRSIILATGGAGALYANTDNPQGMTGDGYALALAAGLQLMDMEFVQFYPLCMGRSRTSRLLPPLLGEVGSLENVQGEDIVRKYDIQPRPVAIAARDKLCQAMAQEVQAGNGFPEGGLRLRILQEDSIWRKAQESFGLESLESLRAWTEQQASACQGSIPVRPAAHFCMGGLALQGSAGTSLSGLFAAGEVTGGLHGANRHGGNALAETAVFGRVAAEEAALAAKHLPEPAWSRLEAVHCKTGSAFENRPQEYSRLRSGLQELMGREAGILRSAGSLRKAQQELDELRARLEQYSAGSRSCMRSQELVNMHQVAETIVCSALAREESRGSHYRTDFPSTEDAFSKHILLQRAKDGIRLSWEDA